MIVRSGKSVRSSAMRRSLVWSSVILIVALSGTVCAQDTGKNAVISSGGSAVPSPSFFDATQFSSGVDPCQAILATFGHLPATGGTVDARGLVSGTGTTLICSVNPIPSGAKGRLLLSSGTYLAQVPWVIQSNDFNIVGTGPSDNAGSNNTIIQACASGQTGCGGVVFQSGQGVIQMGTSSKTVFRSTVKELAVDCQGVAGVSGFQVIAAEEETVFDLVRTDGCPVVGIDIGVGDANVENGAALSNFEVNYTGGVGCPAVTAGSMSSATRIGNVVTAIVSTIPTPALVAGNEVVITGWSNPNFNGTYRLSSVVLPVIKYMTSATGGSTTGTGSVSPYPVGVRVWQESSAQIRGISNGTINGSACASPPPIAMELSGGSPFVHNVHTEGFTVGVQLGDLSGTSGATLTNVKPDNQTTTGIEISSQYLSAGSAPGALPTGNIDIFNLDVTGGGAPPTTYSIIDNINRNTLTQSAGNGAVGYYLFGLNGVMTSAKPESGLINAFDINGLTTAIYSGSASPSFSAGPAGATVGGGNTLQVGAGTAGNGSHILTAQSGTDTAGTCQIGSSLPTSCTVTFHTVWGAAPPACIASDQTSATAIKVLPSTTNVIFYGPASDTVAYHCVGNPN